MNVKRRSRRRNFKKRTYRKPRRVTNSVKKYVKRTLRANIENKIRYELFDLSPIFPTIGTTIGDTSVPIRLMPTIAQSGGQSGRIGNEITLTRFRVKGVVHANPTQTYPELVKVIIFSRKRINDMNTSVGIQTYSRFLQMGNSATNYNDTIDTFMLPFNRDVVKIHDVRTFKIGNATHSGIPANNDYSTDKLFNMDCLKGTKHRFKLRYDDLENANLPQNFERWIVAIAVRPNGVAHTAEVNDCNYSFAVDVQYEDA